MPFRPGGTKHTKPAQLQYACRTSTSGHSRHCLPKALPPISTKDVPFATPIITHLPLATASVSISISIIFLPSQHPLSLEKKRARPTFTVSRRAPQKNSGGGESQFHSATQKPKGSFFYIPIFFTAQSTKQISSALFRAAHPSTSVVGTDFIKKEVRKQHKTVNSGRTPTYADEGSKMPPV